MTTYDNIKTDKVQENVIQEKIGSWTEKCTESRQHTSFVHYEEVKAILTDTVNTGATGGLAETVVADPVLWGDCNPYLLGADQY